MHSELQDDTLAFERRLWLQMHLSAATFPSYSSSSSPLLGEGEQRGEREGGNRLESGREGNVMQKCAVQTGGCVNANHQYIRQPQQTHRFVRTLCLNYKTNAFPRFPSSFMKTYIRIHSQILYVTMETSISEIFTSSPISWR